MAIQGKSCVLDVHVIDNNIPLLLPVDFRKTLGMILSMPDMKIHWKHINAFSAIHEVPGSGHLAIEIFEYPPGGWKNPYEHRKGKVTENHPDPNPTIIPRSAFELQPFCSSQSRTFVHENLEDARSSSVPFVTKREPRYRKQWYKNYNTDDGMPHFHYQIELVEEPLCEDPLYSGQLRQAASTGSHPGKSCLQEDLQPVRQSQGSQHDSESYYPRGDRRKTVDHQSGRSPCPLTGEHHDVSASHRGHETQRQQNNQLVDVQDVQQPLGTSPTPELRRIKPASTTDRCGCIRQTRGPYLQTGLRGGITVLPVVCDDTTTTIGGTSGSRPFCDLGPTSGDPNCGMRDHGSDLRQQLGERGKRRHFVNYIVQGQRLSTWFSLPLIGYVAQVYNGWTPHLNLEGPVFGERVAIYTSSHEEGPWDKVDTTETTLPVSEPSDESGGCLSSPSHDDFHEWTLTLYRTILGAFESSTEVDSDCFVTVPKTVHKAISNRLTPPAVSSLSFPMETIPEEIVPPPDELPEERIEYDDDNEEPASDEDDLPPLDQGWKPTTTQVKDLKIAHDNAGHPSNADFGRLLRRGNARPEVAQWVRKHFSCEECTANKQPKARRPAAVPRTYRVNHVVGLDLIEMKNLSGDKIYWINCICWGSSFQLVGRVGGHEPKTARNVWMAFIET